MICVVVMDQQRGRSMAYMDPMEVMMGICSVNAWIVDVGVLNLMAVRLDWIAVTRTRKIKQIIRNMVLLILPQLIWHLTMP